MMRRPWMLLAIALMAFPVMGKEATPVAEDPVLEARLQKLAKELRCLVCQNESLADSNADLAHDLRREMREMMKQGKSNREIVDFLVARYGDFVLYRPPLKPTTAALWAGPFVLLATGAVALAIVLRRRQARQGEPPLNEEERRKADALLQAGGERDAP
ncbi:cytochrome c-type biogenesis protein [Pelomicrobium methylotrophicum]